MGNVWLLEPRFSLQRTQYIDPQAPSASQTDICKHWCGTRAIIASNAPPVLVFKFLVGFSQLTAKFTQSAIMEKSREFGMRTFD